MTSRNFWTQAELDTLRAVYPTGGIQAAMSVLNRARKAIFNKVSELQLPNLERWTPEQDDILRENYDELGAAAVGKMLGRTARAIRQRAMKLGVKADLSEACKRREPARRGQTLATAPAFTAPRFKPAPLEGKARITSKTKVTIAPPFVDRRFTPTGPIPSVVDSSQCREWAK